MNILQESMMEWGQEMFFLRFGRKKHKKILHLAIIIIYPPSQKNGLIYVERNKKIFPMPCCGQFSNYIIQTNINLTTVVIVLG